MATATAELGSPGDRQVPKVVGQQPRSSRRSVRSSPRRACGEEQAECPPTKVRSLAVSLEESSLSAPATRSSPRKVNALMAGEASAPTSRMRTLAKRLEQLSPAVPPGAPPQPKSKDGEGNSACSKPAEMLPPRESRLNVRQQRREANLAVSDALHPAPTSSTVDYISLSACGDLREYADGAEATRPRRMDAPRCEDGPPQARSARKRSYSQDSLAHEMLSSLHRGAEGGEEAGGQEGGEAAGHKKKRVQKRLPEEAGLSAAAEGGPCKTAPRTPSQMSYHSAHDAGRTSSSRSTDDKASDEVGGFEETMTKLVQQMEGSPPLGPPRPGSRLEHRSESSMSVLSQSQNQDRRTPLPLHMQLGRRTPDMRNTGSTAGTVGPAPSIKDLAECRSRLSSRQGEEGMGRFSAMSRQVTG